MPRTYVDRGGTFTDVVVVSDDGRSSVRKVRSDEAVVGELAEGALTFGTTVATNALLEGKAVPTLLITNRGLGDLVHLGDMARPAIFDPDRGWPPPPFSEVVEVAGRLDAEGAEVEPLELGDLPLDGMEAIAIALLHSNRNPAHELRVAEHVGQLCRERGLPVPLLSLGHRASPEIGLLARVETSLVDAGVTPVLRAALTRDRIRDGALAMRSDGGLSPALELRAPDAVLSGPAGGVLAVAAVAEQAGFARAVGLDMGGTSTDLCRVDAGRLPRREGEVRAAGVRLRRPMLEVETIAAGGGSILSSDGLRLKVGPESAGADPGPQCYGRGGPPTLTDAALAAGLVDPTGFDPPLDPSRVRLPGPAEQFLSIARESMAQAVSRLATARGIDLRDHALVSYGGAAGQHAAEVAARLGIRAVLVHPCASVLSAFGQALARREESAVSPLWRRMPEAWTEARSTLERLLGDLPELGDAVLSVDLRHEGTDHAIEITCAGGGADLAEEPNALLAAFAVEHRRRYGFDRPELPVEIVNVRARVRGPRPTAPPTAEDPWGIGSATARGPELLVEPSTSIWVPPGWQARRADGLLHLEPTAPAPPSRPTERTPYAVELWGRRFAAVAEEAGALLRRLARSVNIRERLDFSCAVFDGRGRLVANAPHIPVHLGAMGETVRGLISELPEIEDGQAYLSNDPAAGGTHLPDLTVTTPVAHGDARSFVACRAHHVDVGGSTPGSMPPRSTQLDHEGFVVRNMPLLREGRLRGLAELLDVSRRPGDLRADLEAQVAANTLAARRLTELGPAPLVETWMSHLRDVAAEAVSRAISSLDPGRAEDKLDGVPLRLSLSRRDGRLVCDFAGTEGPHAGNLNAPPAVVRAAVLYALRVLVGRDLPLNEGTLEPVEIRVPAPSILAPPPGAAVAGGNVETSQRIVDLFLRAAGARAASQGTMNNLTLGHLSERSPTAASGAGVPGDGWSYYETLGGGLGATGEVDGQSGRQVHMTNTRATDVEVLENRFPLRVRRFSLRRGSGGKGEHAGGDGVVREIALLAPAQASLLATRRRSGAPGLRGGEAGVPGEDSLLRGGEIEAWDGSPVELEAGDALRVETPGGGGYGEPVRGRSSARLQGR